MPALAAEAAVDTLEHGFTIDADVARLLVANRVTVVSTLSVLQSWQRLRVHHHDRPVRLARTAGSASPSGSKPAQQSVRMAHAAGVAIAAGSDFGGGSVRAGHLAWEVEGLVRAGLEPWEALGAATWRGGDVLRDPRAGSAAGGPAHFALVHGDPLSDPAALWRVWRAL